jgi:hypothetical protein
MSDSEFDSTSDSDSGSDFDRDDDLRALLRGGDPAGSLSPADPAALASLLEDIMSADLDVRPETDEGSRATGTHGRNRLTWLVAAAAVAAIAGVGGVALSGLGDDSAPPSAGKQAPTVKDPEVGAGIAGETTSLGVSDQQGKCQAATPELLAQYDVAFQGTVTSIEGDTVTLETTDVLNGEVGEAVQVTAPAGLGAMLGTVDFQVGGSYLVAAFNGQVSQCYTGSASGDLRSPFDKAFVH